MYTSFQFSSMYPSKALGRSLQLSTQHLVDLAFPGLTLGKESKLPGQGQAGGTATRLEGQGRDQTLQHGALGPRKAFSSGTFLWPTSCTLSTQESPLLLADSAPKFETLLGSFPKFLETKILSILPCPPS